MPLQGLPFDSKQELLNHLQNDMGLDSDKAGRVADILVEESKSDEGNPKQLLQSIKNGAKSILSGIGLETVSWVENPSQDSMFVMMKNQNNMVKKTTKVYKEPEEDEWETVYGPVMRPNDIDKDGDIAPSHDIKKAAHEFMAEGRVNQFDQDHDLNTGKGTLVESWILKEEKDYELPDGSKETIEAGSWMVGVQPNQEVKQRIENNEITGWSIFGQADKVELKNQANWKSFNNESVTNEFKDDTMSENPDPSNEELSLKDIKSQLKEFQKEFQEFTESPEPSTIKSVEELKQHVKSEEHTNLIELGKDFTLEENTEKEPEMEDMTELLNYLEESLAEENFSMLMDAVRGDGEEEEVEEETDEEDEDDYNDKEKEEKAEKSESPKHKHKQVDTQIEKQERGSVDFQSRVRG